jgi:hypothetical protein
MKVEMLKDRNYRGEHCAAGTMTDMDEPTARWFIERGWAREYAAPAPLTVEQAEALVPTKVQRRRAIR